MTHEEANELIFSSLKKVLIPAGKEAPVLTAETRFIDLGMDSLQFMEFVALIEDSANVKIDDSDFNNIRTVNDAGNLLVSRA